jgi:hemerythrin-like domain-containing protein
LHLLRDNQKPYDSFIEAASIMALGHNVIIRGLNSIYRQAPCIEPEEHADFIAYAKCWHEVLYAHHKMEEDTLFPQIEAKTGEIGIMAANVEQHRRSSLQVQRCVN